MLLKDNTPSNRPPYPRSPIIQERGHHSNMPPLSHDYNMGRPVSPDNRTVHLKVDGEAGCSGVEEERVKCALVGDGGIGKTSLVISYTQNGYPIEYVPTAYDDYSVVVTVNNQPISLQLCDTAGQDDFDKLRQLCYEDTDVFLVCFSVVSPTSFQNISEKWIQEIRSHSSTVPIVLVGTQCDLRNDVKVLIELNRYSEVPVSHEDAIALASSVGAVRYVECSALTQKNLKDVFDTAIMAALEHQGLLEAESKKGSKKSKSKKSKDRSKTYDTNCNAKAKTKELKAKRGWKKWCCFS